MRRESDEREREKMGAISCMRYAAKDVMDL
jgi:hypothetical protein